MTIADEAAAAVSADYPGLSRRQPLAPGASLADVELDSSSTALYAWGDYAVHVSVSPAPEGFRVQATATILADVDVPLRHGSPVVRPVMLHPELGYPPCYAISPENRGPEFGAAVLHAVAGALDYAAATVAAANAVAEDGERMQVWERQRPAGVSQRAWLKQKRTAM